MARFFRDGAKFDPLLQMIFGTVAIEPPLQILCVGAVHPRSAPKNVYKFWTPSSSSQPPIVGSGEELL